MPRYQFTVAQSAIAKRFYGGFGSEIEAEKKRLTANQAKSINNAWGM